MNRGFKAIIVWLLTLLLAIPSFPITIIAETSQEINIKVLNISELENQTLTATQQFGDFTVTATSDKTVVIETHNKTADDGESFTKRLKLGGSGTAEYRSIHFSTSGEAVVTVYAMSASSSSADRKLNLYKLDGTLVASVNALGSALIKNTIEITEAGGYYFVSPDSGVNVYYISVQEGSSQSVQRPDWDEVEPPTIISVELDENDKSKIIITFELVTGDEGADKAYVYIKDSDRNEVDSILVGRSSDTIRTVTFVPESSGKYSFQIVAMRDDEETIKESNIVSFNFLLPLTPPYVSAYTAKDNSLLVEWEPVKEAERYIVEYKKAGEAEFKLASDNVTELSYTISNLEVGQEYVIRVTAVRGEDSASSEISKVVAEHPERKWKFARFGQSTSDIANRCEVLEGGKVIKLYSATYKEDGTIDKKGGKFTSFFDGISYYYTEVDPYKENFVFTATFHVDYLNPNVDGQEGFGIIIRDSIGEHGSTELFMTNSAAILATKLEKVFPDGTKVTLKDGLGTRFTYGLTQEHIEKNTTEGATVEYNAFSWDPNNVIKQGESYTLTLKKTNTGYHAILNNDPSTEIIMYDNYWKKLTVLDPEKIYVGLAVARGCNVTVTDISFITSDPATDPPPEPEPRPVIEPSYRVVSPTKTGNEDYKFVFLSNADGNLTVKDSKGNILIDNAEVKASVDFTKMFKLKKGINEYTVIFTPKEGYITEKGEILSSYETVEQKFTVIHKTYETQNNTIFVTPDGSPDGDGTIEAPLDIYTAVSYVRPGQTIILDGGVYKMTSGLKIPRGIDGTEEHRIVMTSMKGERAILDFAGAGGGFELWGSYWHIYGIDICNTDGNIKGMQIAGHHNIIESVNAYNNGDTGIQISGTSTEPFEKWPSHNLILNCTSYNNCDPGHNNADGFAAKLTVGEGNVFRGCIAYNNLDDGWDLYAKVDTGPIGAVVIENCVAYRNGTVLDGSASGEGNGFKLGGEGIPVRHVIRNSIAFANDGNGITSNSNPAIIVENTTSAFNGGSNYALYGKGDIERSFEARNNISYKGGKPDNIELASLRQDPSNYFDGKNINGETATEDWFVSTDINIVPERDASGTIDMKGLFELTDAAPQGVGAVIGPTPGSEIDEEPVSGITDEESSSDDESVPDDEGTSYDEGPVEDEESSNDEETSDDGEVSDDEETSGDRNGVESDSEDDSKDPEQTDDEQSAKDELVKTGSWIDIKALFIIGIMLLTIGVGLMCLEKRKINENMFRKAG